MRRPLADQEPSPRVRRLREAGVQYAFIAPATALLIAIIGIPIGMAWWLSLNKVKLVPPDQAFMGFGTTFVGLGNYESVITTPDVQNALSNTIGFSIGTVIGSLLLGLLLALLVNQPIRFRTLWRLLLLTPWLMAPAVSAGTWRWIYDPRYGVLNDLLTRLGLIHDPILWLADINLAMGSVTVANIWLRTPFMMVMFLAGLQAIPGEQYEAAAVDGANGWQRFWHVTIPNLRFVLAVACLLEAIWTFKHFDLIQVMTKGGPAKATEVLATLVYRFSFTFFDFGPAAAVGVLMTLFLLASTVVYMRVLRMQNAD